MSTHYHLYCEKTGECIEAVAHVGNASTPRVDANAMGAFFLYHQMTVDSAPLVLIQLDSLDEDRTILDSLEAVAEETQRVGGFHGYKPPVLVWTDANYRSLAARSPVVLKNLSEFEHRAGVWRLTTERPAESSQSRK